MKKIVIHFLLFLVLANNCRYVANESSLELFLLQDTSYSFQDDMDNLKALLPKIMDNVLNQFTSARIGLAVFSDKGFGKYGYDFFNDDCFSLISPLTNDTSKFSTSISKLKQKHGGDIPESQLDGILDAITQVDEIGWSKDPPTVKAQKIVVVATDSPFHEPIEGLKKAGVLLPDATGDSKQNCKNRNYPSVELIAEQLSYLGVRLIFLVTEDHIPYYLENAGRFGSATTVKPKE
eukprot:GHVP01053446.1.p1 GENE.GHVP01053446.1~~GHVP01053446.1.p1  ORF type:complete len:235 (+),score=44.57 GHVP01053446.1:280-984(+)